MSLIVLVGQIGLIKSIRLGGFSTLVTACSFLEDLGGLVGLVVLVGLEGQVGLGGLVGLVGLFGQGSGLGGQVGAVVSSRVNPLSTKKKSGLASPGASPNGSNRKDSRVAWSSKSRSRTRG